MIKNPNRVEEIRLITRVANLAGRSGLPNRYQKCE
jgi:hypothetical protein